jgi:hypothetical protein
LRYRHKRLANGHKLQSRHSNFTKNFHAEYLQAVCCWLLAQNGFASLLYQEGEAMIKLYLKQ